MISLVVVVEAGETAHGFEHDLLRYGVVLGECFGKRRQQVVLYTADSPVQFVKDALGISCVEGVLFE